MGLLELTVGQAQTLIEDLELSESLKQEFKDNGVQYAGELTADIIRYDGVGPYELVAASEALLKLTKQNLEVTR